MEQFKYVGAAFEQDWCWLDANKPDGYEFTLEAFLDDPKQTFRIVRCKTVNPDYAGYAVCVKTYVNEEPAVETDDEDDYAWSETETKTLALEVPAETEEVFVVQCADGLLSKFIPGDYASHVEDGVLYVNDPSTDRPCSVFASGHWLFAGVVVLPGAGK